MAVAKTSDFWITEALDCTVAGTVVQGTMDLGHLLDVADQQAVSIEEIDFLFQHHDVANDVYSGNLLGISVANWISTCQIADVNPGTTFLRNDDSNLIGSGVLLYDDGNNVSSIGPDLFPDQYGKTAGRIVVNDQLYFTTVLSSAGAIAANQALTCVVRIRMKVVKLTTKDWIALALTSVSSDT